MRGPGGGHITLPFTMASGREQSLLAADVLLLASPNKQRRTRAPLLILSYQLTAALNAHASSLLNPQMVRRLSVVSYLLATARGARSARLPTWSRGVACTPSPRLNKAAVVCQSGGHIAGHCLPDPPALPAGPGQPWARLERAVHLFQEERVLPHAVKTDACVEDCIGFAVPVKPRGSKPCPAQGQDA